MTSLFQKYEFKSRVSSVLNKNVKQYGHKFLFDNNSETSWNSENGSPQWIFIEFENTVTLASFHIEFQGGFVGKNCHIEAGDDETKFVEYFYPEDSNANQKFNLSNSVTAKKFKIIFNESTDFFGRIIIYNLAFYSESS